MTAAIEALGHGGCDAAALSAALRGERAVQGALADVNEVLSDIGFRLSAGRDAAAGGVRLALTAGLLGGIIELFGAPAEEWPSALAAGLGGLVGAGLGWEMLRRADDAARAARSEWDRMAGSLERALRGAAAVQGGSASGPRELLKVER